MFGNALFSSPSKFGRWGYQHDKQKNASPSALGTEGSGGRADDILETQDRWLEGLQQGEQSRTATGVQSPVLGEWHSMEQLGTREEEMVVVEP